ncbi:hypothetical protein [Spiroplasma floricola]|uniref:Uncharacterized protein n=1 Tax=Spiroplasma floricola 23-6 TaxID=1336749 RepID=A0A2K8SFD4_9MOLU|nr:hypothetical protein [Spiroplasma floricola]AUB32143.1 hypothetical protein SFLOR_v1c10970 [Spiroplasma floricola 23-6]
MSFTIQNAKFFNRKLTPKSTTFRTKDSEKTTVISYDKNLRRNFKNILQGKYLVKNGLFKIDGYDKVNKQWTKRKVAVIKANTLFRKWPEKFWLYTSLLLNKNFYSQAKINYINKKYSYLSFSTSKNNKTDLEMRDKIETMISKFINNSIEIEEQWVSEFLNQIVKFNNTNLQKSYGDMEEHIRIIIKDYYYLVEKTQNLEFIQTFLQTLFDKVYTFMELSSLCTCEYVTKKSKDKQKRKLAKELNFHQINFVTRKQLKILDLQVNNIKAKISKNNFIIKGLKKQIVFELNKAEIIKKRIRNLDELFTWRKASYDQRFEFKKKQEKMFFEGLSDEATTLRGKIVEVMHKYHKRVLNDNCEKGEIDEFKVHKDRLKREISSVYKQSTLFIDETAKQLGFEFNLLSFKLSKMEEIWFQLLTAIYLKKYNLIFYNVLAKLNHTEKQNLLSVIDNLFNLDSHFSIVFIEDNINDIAQFNKNIYLINEQELVENSLDEILKKYYSTYGGDFFAKNNRFSYKYDGKKLETMNETTKTQSDIFDQVGKLVINPMKVYTNKKENKNYIIELVGTIIENNKFADPNMYEALIKETNLKIYFYSTQKFEIEEKVKLYIGEDSILKIM